MREMDIFFITYDEPQKEGFWLDLKERCPTAQRVDNIKGFDRAHKECARVAQTDRFFIIDGDNRVLDSFLHLDVSDELLDTDYVLSWASQNSINGLAYGNGGIKNWRKDVVMNMRSHEEATEEDGAVDFCFQLNYFQMPDVLSVSHVNQTSYQAFRAGFREGVKMSLDRGKKITAPPEELAAQFKNRLHASNLERLKIWATVGADVSNGLWAIYGCRLGCWEFYFNNTPLESIRDYDWFQSYWEKEILPKREAAGNETSFLLDESAKLGKVLNQKLQLELTLLNPVDSRFFKSVYFNRPRQGLMFPCTP